MTDDKVQFFISYFVLGSVSNFNMFLSQILVTKQSHYQVKHQKLAKQNTILAKNTEMNVILLRSGLS